MAAPDRTRLTGPLRIRLLTGEANAVDTHQLAAFKASYESESMSKAAKELFITPQGLSRSIASLESELGRQLFVRTRQGVRPTDYARSIYPKACKTLELMQSMLGDPSAGQSAETISVASVSGGLSFFGQRFFDEFACAHPGLSISMTEGNDRRCTELVTDGMADCGIVSGSIDLAMLDATLIARHPHALLAAKDSELAKSVRLRDSSGVELSDLAGRRIGIMGEGYSPYRYIRERMLRDRVMPSELVGFAEMSTGIRQVRDGTLYLVTTDFVVPPNSDDDVAVLPFSDKQFTWDEYFVTLRGASPSEAVTAFRAFILSWFKAHEKDVFCWRSKDGTWPLACER